MEEINGDINKMLSVFVITFGVFISMLFKSSKNCSVLHLLLI